MTITENKQLALQYLEAVGSADVAQLEGLLANEFSYWVAPSTKFSGTYDRAQFLFGVAHLFDDASSPFAFTFLELTAEEDRVSVTATGSVMMKNGKKYENHYHNLITVRDGKITAAREYMDTAHVNEVFGAPDAKA